MDVKEAVAKARTFAQDAFGADDLGLIRLEEIDHDDVARDWLITLGLYRPAVASRGQQIASLMGNAELKRSYRVFRVSEATGDVKSVKIREFLEQE